MVAYVYPENATDSSVEWNSSDPLVATVDNNGNVSALAEGEAINLDGKLSDIVSEGTIKINGASFTIDDKTTLQSLINEINSSSEANVNVRFNTVSNKLTFTSKETGETNIEFESEDSDFFL